MKKYDLLRSGDNIIRVLETQGDKVLVIDCIKRTMPIWVDATKLEAYSECTSSEPSEITGIITIDVDALDAGQRKTMYERYTMIAPILSFVADDWMRSRLICSAAEDHGVSKQTIRGYLCLYLAYMDVTALAPRRREDDRALTQDEKNIRWALNKFFYTTKKHSLMTAYTMMLKEKYCDTLGVLAEEYPSYYQFRYFYRKTRHLQNFYISRDGLKDYQRNNRPLTGDGVQEFAPAVGTGMFDATVCDIYLVNDSGSLVGRPILTACVDAYSSLCCGYSLSWEGGVYSLRGLMLNIIADKVVWCEKFGISIHREDWDCDIGNLNPGAMEQIAKMYSLDKLVLEHTMYPQYARFIPLEQKKTALYRLGHDNCDAHHLFCVLPRSEGEQYLRLCPLCVQEDRETYGEAYWHRKHQIRNMSICTKHRCRLMESSVPAKSEQSFTFCPAEHYMGCDKVVFEEDPQMIRFASYLESIFEAPMDFRKDIPISSIMYDGLSRTKYLKPSGRSRYTKMLADDLNEFYREMGLYNIASMYQIQKVLLGSRSDFSVVCQIAFSLAWSWRN